MSCGRKGCGLPPSGLKRDYVWMWKRPGKLLEACGWWEWTTDGGDWDHLIQRRNSRAPRSEPQELGLPKVPSQPPGHLPTALCSSWKLPDSWKAHGNSQKQHPFGAIQWSDTTLPQGSLSTNSWSFGDLFEDAPPRAGPFIFPSSFSFCHGEEAETALGSDPTWCFPSSLSVCYLPVTVSGWVTPKMSI